ncbi:MAG: LysM peptidoglycan-binding domain-containing protein [Chloroflexota bacterium]|nr:LysM peptidoglycan-binding domain-containing protein [Chloroflexota bacterium]
MRAYRSALVTLCVGVLTFGVVFGFLELRRSGPAPGPALADPTSAPVPAGPSSDSLALGMPAGQIAVGVPSAGSELLLQAARPGDRLDILASLPSPADGRPVTGVVVSGATVLRPATLTEPLVVQVSGADAIALAHLVLGGTHLVYTVRPVGEAPSTQPPLDERTARALLDLPALATPVPPISTPTPVPAPAPVADATPRPTTYTAQTGDSLYSVASRLGVEPGALWWANRTLVDPTLPLVPGSVLLVPSFSGFLYQVQVGDTWDSVAATFGAPAADLRSRNELPDTASLVSGMLLFIPRDS